MADRLNVNAHIFICQYLEDHSRHEMIEMQHEWKKIIDLDQKVIIAVIASSVLIEKKKNSLKNLKECLIESHLPSGNIINGKYLCRSP